MSIIRIANKDRRRGGVNRARIAAATEAQIEKWKEEEGYGGYKVGKNVRAIPAVDVRAIREGIGLSQSDFALKYRLSLRTVQEWEQGRKQPSEAARVLLLAISREPKAIARALRP